jgi:hypothetical protein
MTIKITGRTFDEREKIKAIGGQWDGVNRVWTLPDFTPEYRLNELRNTPGISVIMPDGKVLMPGKVEPPEYEKREPLDIAEIIKAITDGDGLGDNRFRDIEGSPTVYGNDETWLGKFAKNPTAFFGFDSWSAMVDFIEAIPSNITNDRSNNRNTGWSTSKGAWIGTASMERAISMARAGWPSGAEMAARAVELLDADHPQQRRRKYSVAGGKVNVGRMLAGSPDHMIHRPRQDGRKIVTLLVDVWMASAIAAENAIIRAACVAAMADLLESRGYSCEIVAVGSAYANGRINTAVNVKQAGDALNVLDVVFSLGHPSMLRRFCFALAAYEPRLRQFWSSMGFQEAAFTNLPAGQFYINKLNGNLSGSFDDKVRDAFQRIIPAKFPIDIRNSDR